MGVASPGELPHPLKHDYLLRATIYQGRLILQELRYLNFVKTWWMRKLFHLANLENDIHKLSYLIIPNFLWNKTQEHKSPHYSLVGDGSAGYDFRHNEDVDLTASGTYTGVD